MLDLTERERMYLVTVLKAAHTQMLHELHHADSMEFKDQLKHQIEMNEQLLAKVQGKVALAV